MHELGTQLPADAPDAPEPEALSAVDRAMRRNAPDLAGASRAEILAAERRRTAHLDARWPRPRLLALILMGTLAISVPAVTFRLALWGLILFLVAAVAVGPERARDGAIFLWRRFARLWKHELVVFNKLVGRLPEKGDIRPTARRGATYSTE